MDKLSDPSHPLWALSRLIVVMLSLVVVLYLNAASFDKTELQTIITMFVIAGGAEGATQFVRGLAGGKK